MYRNRSGHGGWYQAFFWVLVGFVLGQIIQLDIDLAPRQGALPQQTTTEVADNGEI